MYVKKFEGDSLDETLKAIKADLGPDAIILKTITNKGLKGAFRKKRIEITAAISEKNYRDKIQVDRALSDDHKDQFYQAPSSHVSQMIETYNHNTNPSSHNMGSGSYGNIGVNRSVKTKKSRSSKLDSFLGTSEKEDHLVADISLASTNQQAPTSTIINDVENIEKKYESSSFELNDEIRDQQIKIDILEKKLKDLSEQVTIIQEKDPCGILYLRTMLTSLGIEDMVIKSLVKRAIFNLNAQELDNAELVFEFALKEMASRVKTDLPLFSKIDSQEPVVTVFLSGKSAGQSRTVLKLGALKPESKIIQLEAGEVQECEFTKKMFNLDVIKVNNVSHVASECRKAIANGQSVFIDFKNLDSNNDETKKFIEGLKRSFEHVQVLLCLSSIHQESYNRLIYNKYLQLVDGLVVTNIDLCLNYGSIFNIHQIKQGIPLVFFGTGETVPDDIESASCERLLGGLLKADTEESLI